MNLKDFYIVASKVLELLTDYDTTPKYQSLIQNLSAIRSSPTQELQDSISAMVEEIAEQNSLVQDKLSTIPHASFVMERLAIDDCIGSGATDRLQNIIRTEAYVAPTSISKLVENIASVKRQLQNIINEFNNFGIKYDAGEDKSILSVEYSGSTQVETTEDLSQQLGEIEKIVHAYARLTDNPDAFKKPSIISMSKSSPLVIDIGDGVGVTLTLTAICKTITWVMNRIEQVYDIRIKREQLKAEKLSNKKIEDGFDDLINKQFSDDEIKKHVAQLYKDSNPSANNGAKTEVEKALLEAAKSIISLIDEQGANVKVFLDHQQDKEESADNNDAVNINNAYLRLERKQEELKALDSGLQKGKKAKDNVQENA